MKKFLLACVALLGLAIASPKAEAQTPTFVKGDNTLSATIGLGTSFDFSGIPPIGIHYEHGLIDDLFNNGTNVTLGVGAETDFWSYSTKSLFGNYSQYYGFLGVRGALHKSFVDNLDTYAGISIGLDYYKYSFGNLLDAQINSLAINKQSNVGLGWSTFIGCKYYFTPNWAAGAELGWGITLLNIGVTYKF